MTECFACSIVMTILYEVPYVTKTLKLCKHLALTCSYLSSLRTQLSTTLSVLIKKYHCAYLHVGNIHSNWTHKLSPLYCPLPICIIISINFHESLVLDTEIGACFCRLGHTLSIWASETDSCWAMDTARVLSIPVSCLIDSSMLSS